MSPITSRMLFAIALWLVLGGCDRGEEVAARPPPSRVVAVRAEEPKGPDLETFCDVRPAAPDAPELTWPPVDGDKPGPTSGTWRWVNVWATWCQPCVEEMPRLLEWKHRLEKDQAPVDLVFLSLDDSEERVEAYRQKHPATPKTLRLTEQGALEGWVTGVGADPGATIPLQVFADAENRVRCVRSGAVNEGDYGAVKRLASMN